MPAEAAAFDDHSGNARIVKAALCAGFYPAILRVEHPTAVFAETHGGALQKDADPARLKFFDRRRGAPPAAGTCCHRMAGRRDRPAPFMHALLPPAEPAAPHPG